MRRLALALLALLPGALGAETAPVLDRFYAETQSLEGRFEQELVGRDGEALERSSGRFWLQRPGRFRWDYETPYEQRIVADGERLWVYEPELEQATVRPLREDAGDVPGLLLAGSGVPDELFELRSAALGDSGWVALDARSDDAGVTSVRIRFDAGLPQELEFTDALGQRTRIRFSGLRANAPAQAARFRFTPPPGTDVIGE